MVAFERPELTELKPRITVIGVGGAGGNAVANMIESQLDGVDFVVANTDAQALSASSANTRIQLGHKITQGLGAGARPEIGRAAAEENADEIEQALEGSHMCFITAGMGGGTGTGAAPVIAQQARERGILTVGVVTKPFSFEGAKRARAAESGIAELQKHVDTLIVIPNQNLFMIASPQTTFREAFSMADQVLHQGVRGITDLMMMPGLINLDFADVRTVMSEMGKAMMGTGEAEGENRAIEAANKAVSNPLLDEVSLRGARALLINITGGDDMGLMEVDEAANHIRDMVDADANIIFGSAFNPDLNGTLRVSVVATGIEASDENRAEPSTSQPRVSFGTVAGSFGSAAPAPRPVAPAQAAPATAAAPAPAPAARQETPAEPEPESTESSYLDEAYEDDTAASLENAAETFADDAREDEDDDGMFAEEAPEPAPSARDDAEQQPSIGNVRPLRADPAAAPAATVSARPTPQPAAPPAMQAEPEQASEDEAEELERPYVAAQPAEEEPQRGPSLFERMTSIGRGAPKAKKAREDLFAEDEKTASGDDPLEIPAFFKRQVND